ncbi:hypothetical protein [Burkholderia thailandensis]|uniref:hypothetical protein n=1 Tax=Burkholderia thailandensis TaxID=57975 RepID=UPI002166B638|nr:hypothetical protein [Burkholderia thailandensis]MCS3390359.1 hypothetical protein [Burkholderia thailandensis]
MTLERFDYPEDYERWLQRHRETGFIFSPNAGHSAASRIHMASCGHIEQWHRGFTNLRFGADAIETLLRDSDVRGFMPMHGQATVCRLCERNNPGLSDLVAETCTRLMREIAESRSEPTGHDHPGISAGGSREVGALPKFGDVFRPVAEFEGTKIQTVDGGVREVEVAHGGLTNRLDAALRQFLPAGYETGQNSNVDVAIIRSGEIKVIFECKSNVSNISDALYKAIGQLFVYRCLLRNAETARLVLVLPSDALPDMSRHSAVMKQLEIVVFFGDPVGRFATLQGESLEDWLSGTVCLQ